MNKYEKGDRVFADINGTLISATVERYAPQSENIIVYCKWDDDGELATARECDLTPEAIMLSPLWKALK